MATTKNALILVGTITAAPGIFALITHLVHLARLVG